MSRPYIEWCAEGSIETLLMFTDNIETIRGKGKGCEVGLGGVIQVFPNIPYEEMKRQVLASYGA